MTHAFSPSLVNELVYGLGRGGVFIGPVDDLSTRASHGVDVPLLYGGADPDGILPSVAFGGVANQAFANTNFNGTPFDQKFIIHNVYESLTKMVGRHSFKGGFFYQHATNRRTSFGPVQANLAFGATHPQNTGHPFANALLGFFDTYTQAEAKITSNYVYQNIEGYVQDSWKIKPNLTLDYGLRLSHYQPIYDQENRLGFFNPDLYDPAQAVRLYRPVCVTVSPCAARAIDPAISGAPTVANTRPANYVGTVVPNSGNLTNGIGRAADGYPAGGFTTAPVLWGPRLGFAWDVRGDRRSVVRGGFGITYDRIDTDRVADAITNPPGIQVATLSNGTISSLAAAGRSDIIPVNADVVGWPEDGKVPTVYSYSIGVQKEIGWDMSVDIAYVGTQSRHNPRQTDLNAIPYGAMFLRENQDPTRYNGTVPAVEPTLPAAHAAAGVPFSGATPLNVNLLRPYAGYGSLRSRLFDSKASFNSLQASVQRRFSRNLSFGASYTLSQAKTDSAGVGDATSPFDLGRLRLRARQLRSHALLRRELRLERARRQQAPRRRSVRARAPRQLDAVGHLLDLERQPRGDGHEHLGDQRDQPHPRHRLGRTGGRPAAALPRRGRSAGRARRDRAWGDPGARHRRPRALRSLLPAQPRLQQPRPVGLQELPAAGRQRITLFPVPPGDVQRLQPHAVLGREPDDQPDERRRPDRRGDPERLHEPRDHQQPSACRRDPAPRHLLRRVQRRAGPAHHPGGREAVLSERVDF